jgi:hypothetical protein
MTDQPTPEPAGDPARDAPPEALLAILDRLPPRFGAGGLKRLEALGIDFYKLNACGTPRPARVRVEGRLFAFDDDGEGMLIQPVTDGPQASIFSGVDAPAIADLLAYNPDRPDRWHLFRGESALALGIDAILEASAYEEPLRIFRTPLGWLQAGGAGACLLDWRHWRALLAGVPHLIGEDARHDAWIRRTLAAHRPAEPGVGPLDAPEADGDAFDDAA